jgi:hypothetical protein
MGGMGTLVQEMKQPSVNAKIKVIPYRTGIKTQLDFRCGCVVSVAVFRQHSRGTTGPL